MSNIEEQKQEIIDAIRQRLSDGFTSDIENIVNQEIDILSRTDGLSLKNNFDTFYNIWKKKWGETGSDNKINSWTAYYLGITSAKPDPDTEFLPERRAFARASFPDIDTDFEIVGQDFIFEYLIEKYGREHSGRIGNHSFLTFKSCVSRVSKALDLADAFHLGKDRLTTLNEELVRAMLDIFPKDPILRLPNEDGEMEIVKNFNDAVRLSPEFRQSIEKYPALR
jgi:hypothetical protein